MTTDSELLRRALISGSEETCSDDQLRYYAEAEGDLESQWQRYIWPWIGELDKRSVIDLATGFGRFGTKFVGLTRDLQLIDHNRACIEHCQRRFAAFAHVRCLRNDGASLAGVEDSSVTLIHSFDAMVHFDSDVVRAYLREAARVLAPGGHFFLHHSNYTGSPGEQLDGRPHRRNFMSRELLAHYALKSGLAVIRQQVIDWGDATALDCLSLLQRPR